MKNWLATHCHSCRYSSCPAFEDPCRSCYMRSNFKQAYKTPAILYFITLVIVVASIIILLTATEGTLKYDVTGDGRINEIDAFVIQRVADSKGVDEELVIRCDINNDGVVNSEDVRIITEYIENGGG